jgi:DNA repair protein RecN (Recombination protein N)
MISHISIRDFAIIENIEVSLDEGFSVITGETGAGKSIIVEAISLGLGARADKAMVREGTDKALIQIVVDESDVNEELRTGIEVISREIAGAGKSICRINGEIVTLSELAERTSHLVDIHGQYDNQRLLDASKHLDIIDAYNSAGIFPLKTKVADLYQKYLAAKRANEELLRSESASKRELDFLSYEVKEINAANLRPGELAELQEQLHIMQNSEKIFAALNKAYQVLSGDDAAVGQIAEAKAELESIDSYAAEYKEIAEHLANAYYELEETSARIRSHSELADFSQQTLDDTIARIDVIERLVSKYGEDEESVLAYLSSAVARLDIVENIDERKAELATALKSAEGDYLKAARELSSLRRSTADNLRIKVDEQLKELNFSDAQFDCEFGTSEYSANGIDKVEFLLTANKGQPLRPLARVASGGEMSRIMLALDYVIGEFDGIPSMIFDEIDTGISGITATVVAEKIRKMSEDKQIICITHLPQIAAYASHHFVIHKSSDDHATYTTISEVKGDERIGDIARLLGGKNVTDTTLKSAEELISLSSK